MSALLHDTNLWVGVAFIVFVVLAWRPLSKVIVTALDDRSERIRNDIDEATRLREEAQALLASYKRKQRDAATEAEEILSNARHEAEQLKEQVTADLEALLRRREQQALDRIAQAESQATSEVRGMAVDLAVAATRKLLTDKAGGDRAGALIDESIKEIDEKLH